MIRKILYFFSLFKHVKCADCKWDNMACNVYCGPPLGVCIYEKEN